MRYFYLYIIPSFSEDFHKIYPIIKLIVSAIPGVNHTILPPNKLERIKIQAEFKIIQRKTAVIIACVVLFVEYK